MFSCVRNRNQIRVTFALLLKDVRHGEGYDYLPGFLAAGGKTGSWAGSAAGSAGEAATALRINPGGMAAVSTVRSPFC